MINMKNMIILMSVILITAMASGNAFAGAGWCGPKRDKAGGKKDAIIQKLGLTPDQEKNLKETKEANRKEMKALFQELEIKRSDLKNALKKRGISKRDVEPLMAEVKDLQSKLLDKKVDGIFRVKAILTTEQFDKLQELKKDKAGRMGGNKHGRK